MKKNIFRLLLVICTLALFSFTKKESLKNLKTLNANDTGRRFWGWNCPICTYVNTTAGVDQFTCVSTYFVLGVGVSQETNTCYWNQATQGNLINCSEQFNNGNLNCAASTIGTN